VRREQPRLRDDVIIEKEAEFSGSFTQATVARRRRTAFRPFEHLDRRGDALLSRKGLEAR
jgi:hypothetical protein